jgi:membrane protease YdiL (CAAX protease family)
VKVGLQSAAVGVAKAASGDRVGVALRLFFPLMLLEAALWAPQPLAILCGLCALWYIIWHLWQATGSIVHGHGLQLRGLLREPWLLGATFALSVAIMAAAYYSGSLHRLWGLQHPWYAILCYSCWAFLQEFMLQCFCVRLLSALVSRFGALLLSGVVFALAHLPNLSLTLLTFFAGIVFTAIYIRKRNLYVVAVIHAILGLTLAVSAPETWFHGLRVGRDFLERPPTITAEISPRR